MELKEWSQEELIIQARGRAGRQGDEGSSIFYVSLEDDLMRIFGSESMNKMLEKLGP